jgi:hypothetical protein
VVDLYYRDCGVLKAVLPHLSSEPLEVMNNEADFIMTTRLNWFINTNQLLPVKISGFVTLSILNVEVLPAKIRI